MSRAKSAGCRALVLTVDAPRLGRRLRDARNGFALPPHVVAANLANQSRTGHERKPGASVLQTYAGLVFDASLTWSDLA